MSVLGAGEAFMLASGEDAGYKIDRSLRFDSGSSSHLSRTPSSAGNRKTWTWSAWVKRASLAASDQYLFGAQDSGSFFILGFISTHEFFINPTAGATGATFKSNAKFRDPSAWYHIVVAVDTTQSTASDRVRVYVNGDEITSWATSTYPSQDTEWYVNNNVAHRIGSSTQSTGYCNVYMAEIHHVDGQQLAPTDFGEFDADTGVWNPIEYTGSHNGSAVGQIYSGMLTSSSGFGSAAKLAFDGNLNTGANAVHSNDNYLEFTPTTPINFTNGVQVRCYAANGYEITNYYSVDLDGNGLGSETSFTGGPDGFNGSAWIDVATGSGTLYKLRIRLVRVGSQSGAKIDAIAINGSSSSSNYLVDGTPAGVNGFHLDFSDNSSNAALGTDSSGNNNTWTVNNLIASGLSDTPGVTTQIGQDVTGDWIGILGVTPTNTNGAFATVPDGAGSTQPEKGKFYWSGLTIGDTITVYGTGSGQNRTVTGDVSEASSPGYVAVPGASLGSFTVTVTAASGSCKVDHNGAFTCYGITPGPLAGRYVDDGIDSPTDYEASNGNNGGNYCTLNPLKNGQTLSNGNLDVVGTSSWQRSVGTIGMYSGKYYWEYTITASNEHLIGVGPIDMQLGGNLGAGDPPGSGYGTELGQVNGTGKNSSWTNTGASGAGDVIGIAFDADNGNMYVYKNGTALNSGAASHTGLVMPQVPVVSLNGSSRSGTINFGQRPFAYTPPTGYSSLVTTNLSDPTIADGSTAMDATLWTGNGSTQTISGLNHSPDFIWHKIRSIAGGSQLYDIVRGVSKRLRSDTTDAESTLNGVTAFNSDGWTMNAGNNNNETYVSWTWDGGDLVTNSAYNQSEVWSDGWVLDSGSSWISGPKLSFDGFTGTNTTQTRINGGATWTAGTAVPFTTSLRIWGFDAGSGSIEVNGTDVSSQVTDGTTNAEQWNTITGITSPLSTIRITGTQSITTGIGAVEVDGKILVDTGVIPVGSLNSSVYDQSQTWSNHLTASGTGFRSGNPATNAFDGNFSTNAVTNDNNGTLTLDLSSYSLSGPVRVKFGTGNAGTYSATFTGSSGTQTDSQSYSALQAAAWTSTYDVGTLTSISVTTTSGSQMNLVAVEINGKVLVDSGVTPSTNVPTIASTVRANPSVGFSIVNANVDASLTGGPSIGHGLNKKPEFILGKNRDSTVKWRVFHKDLDESHYLVLNATDAQVSDSAVWGDNNSLDSNVFRIGDGSPSTRWVPSATDNCIFYAWTSIENYSSFGKYEGNGSADGPFVQLSFEPAVVLIKCIDNFGTGYDWFIFDNKRDSYNVGENVLKPNSSGQEYDADSIDFLSNGFKIRTSIIGLNIVSHTFVYAAWASSPFKTARAR